MDAVSILSLSAVPPYNTQDPAATKRIHNTFPHKQRGSWTVTFKVYLEYQSSATALMFIVFLLQLIELLLAETNELLPFVLLLALM